MSMQPVLNGALGQSNVTLSEIEQMNGKIIELISRANKISHAVRRAANELMGPAPEKGESAVLEAVPSSTRDHIVALSLALDTLTAEVDRFGTFQ